MSNGLINNPELAVVFVDKKGSKKSSVVALMRHEEIFNELKDSIEKSAAIDGYEVHTIKNYFQYYDTNWNPALIIDGQRVLIEDKFKEAFTLAKTIDPDLDADDYPEVFFGSAQYFETVNFSYSQIVAIFQTADGINLHEKISFAGAARKAQMVTTESMEFNFIEVVNHWTVTNPQLEAA